MLGLEFVGSGILIAKYILLLFIGFKVFQIVSNILIHITNESVLSELIAFFVSIIVVYLIREMFIVAFIITLLVLYFTGWIRAGITLIKAV